MVSPILRGVAAALLLAALVATDALPVSPASQGRCDMVCCRMPGAMGHGEACQLRPAGPSRCTVGMSGGLPVSFQSQRERAARSGLRNSRPGEVILTSAGWVAETKTIAPPPPPFEPPVPPPRSPRFA
ncbi:MAG TPA: hypothetical protein VGQ28_00335 [Thermoanaerobaculia bacterium]|jgi:hypothetical protein|nr:hypothetical protein [Thermoanaerobaculia bacterium]